MSKVVITGATGSIGMSLVDKHLDLGDLVYVVVREDSNRINNFKDNDNLHIIKKNISDILDVFEDIKSCDYFYHLAWSGVKKELRNDPYIQIENIKYTMDTIKLAKLLNAKKYVGVGSQAEYGLHNEEVSEESNTTPITGYGIAKYASGKLGKLYAEELGINFNWVRVFSVYGIYDGDNTIINTCINNMIDNKEIDFTNSNQSWEFIYSSDCANALYLVMKNGISGEIYNISSGENKELKEYIFKIKEILNSSSKLNFGAIKQDNVVNLNSNIDKLKSIGYEANVSFEEGIERIIKYKKGE